MLARVAAVAAISLVPTAVAVAPAQAYYSCSVSVPSKVSITSPYREITARFSSGCLSYAETASWDVVHPTQGIEDFIWFEGESTYTMDWYDWTPLGRYKVRADGAYDYEWDEMSQNSTTMTVKLGSRTALKGSRSGSTVTLKATATRYSPNHERYRAWSGARASLQKKACSSCSWSTVKSATTNRYGEVTMRSSAPGARYWRVVTADSSTTWGRASGHTKR
ncbi:hypothetical protein AWH69_04685 [Janibacter melonis]|uniref:Uncharacterized protein n=1 Tax=Janibacter melonis TaxID=262209 RepID=A0A176QCI5_9MICO|nr:hypothetical protein [Janibacter melonis]OAB87392.1 hypothetical protein AWH69_04685 [Janibacter melonis]